MLEAIDSDVIKTYVRARPGRRHRRRDGGARRRRPAATWSRARPATCSASNVARVAFKRGAYLRNFVYAFAELLSDRLTRALIQRAMGGDGDDDYEL